MPQRFKLIVEEEEDLRTKQMRRCSIALPKTPLCLLRHVQLAVPIAVADSERKHFLTHELPHIRRN